MRGTMVALLSLARLGAKLVMVALENPSLFPVEFEEA